MDDWRRPRVSFPVALDAEKVLRSRRRCDEAQCAFEIVGDGSEADLEGGLCQSAAAHMAKTVASLPGAEDFLDPASDAMDRSVPCGKPDVD